MSEDNRLEKIVSLSKRRGFVFQSSDIYDGFAGVYDYGPYGVLLANNIKEYWWKRMVQMSSNIVGLDSGIFMSPKVWEASGHVGGFSDPLVIDEKNNKRYRADHLLEEVGVLADEKMSEEEINELFDANKDKILKNYKGAEFGRVAKFAMLPKSNLGDFTPDNSEPTYLRAETAQGIYVNYKNVIDSARVKVPFGIAQIGKAFRNEISPRQFLFRTRELEQMELQYFVKPQNEKEEFENLKDIRMQYYLDLGFKKENLRWSEHKNLVFYANAAFDIEYNFPFGFKELEGVHARGDYDLTQHSKHSGVDLNYLDPETNEKYTPHVVEASVGVGRTFLAMLNEFFDEDEIGGESRTVLRLPKDLAPIKVAVFPLLKNKPDLVSKAKEVFQSLAPNMMTEFDDNGNIGKRYRRQDEIGTPFCVTIDFDTLEDDTVTLRDRDTGEQERVSISELVSKINA